MRVPSIVEPRLVARSLGQRDPSPAALSIRINLHLLDCLLAALALRLAVRLLGELVLAERLDRAGLVLVPGHGREGLCCIGGEYLQVIDGARESDVEAAVAEDPPHGHGDIGLAAFVLRVPLELVCRDVKYGLLTRRALARVDRRGVGVIPMTLRVEIPRNLLAVGQANDGLVFLEGDNRRLVTVLHELVSARKADDIARGEGAANKASMTSTQKLRDILAEIQGSR